MSKKITNKLLGMLIAAGIIAIWFINFNFATRPDTGDLNLGDNVDNEDLVLYGNVKAEKSAELGFINGGKITKLPQKAGDFVKAGTILAAIDGASVNAQYQQANDNLLAVKADLVQFENIVNKEEYKLKALKKADAASNDVKAQSEQVDAAESTVEVQRAKIAAAQAGVKNAQAGIDSTIIRAPFDGIIAKQDGEVGEVAAPGGPVIMLISGDNKYEIEAFVSEKDIAKIKIGNKAAVTLDAYPSSEKLDVLVGAMDQGETIVNGIIKYKVIFVFAGNDERIKSGMNANIVLKN